MIETMYIGSGDVHALMSGKETKSHSSLMQRFVSGVKPNYNAYASPIDALRTGAILENRYLLTLPDNYFTQYVVKSEEMDVFKCSLDFAKIEKGKLVDSLVDYVKKKHKSYYNQVQEQLYCTRLESCNLVFLSVTSYDDDYNWNRVIKSNEYCKVRITRDEKAISKIRERGFIFQQIKDFYTK